MKQSDLPKNKSVHDTYLIEVDAYKAIDSAIKEEPISILAKSLNGKDIQFEFNYKDHYENPAKSIIYDELDDEPFAKSEVGFTGYAAHILGYHFTNHIAEALEDIHQSKNKSQYSYLLGFKVNSLNFFLDILVDLDPHRKQSLYTLPESKFPDFNEKFTQLLCTSGLNLQFNSYYPANAKRCDYESEVSGDYRVFYYRNYDETRFPPVNEIAIMASNDVTELDAIPCKLTAKQNA